MQLLMVYGMAKNVKREYLFTGGVGRLPFCSIVAVTTRQ